MAKGCNNANNKKSNSSKPYDASNSFVKKVASRVTGLIPQSTWLSGWFSTPDEVSNRPDTAQAAKFNNDEDSTEDPLEQPPPTKRIKLPDRKYESEMFTPSGCSKDAKKSSPGDFMDMSSVPGPSGQQRVASGFVASTPADQERKANGDDCSESAESTSGCSSLEPQINRGPGAVGQQARPNESLPSRFLDERFNYPSYLQSPRSLFLERSSNSRSNQSASRRKPSFSVTSNSSWFGDRSLNETMVNSPFYSGRTMYGGASSSPYRRSLGSASFTSSTSSDKAGRHTVKVKPSPAQSSVDSGMSETARRILATLEQFSTPLLDAKRIPVSATPQPVLASTSRKRARQETEEPRIFLNHPRSPQLSRKGVHWAKGPPVKELTVPSTPDTLVLHRKERFASAADEALVRQKERLQDMTTAARRLANSVPASNIGLERIYTLRSEDDGPSSGKQSLKMKSDLRTNVRQSRNDKRDEPGEEVILPKIALPITTLPSFDVPVAKPVVSTPTCTKIVVTPTVTPKTPLSTPKAAPKAPAASFSFASPIVVASDHKPISPVAFVFSEPDPVDEEKAPPSSGLNFLPSVPSRPDKPGPKRKSVTVNENGSRGSVFGVTFGSKAPSELRTGSVMDILAKDTKEVNGSVSLLDKFKPAAGSWECDQCMIRNKSDLARCAACTSPRPAAGGKATSNAPVTADLPKVSSSATKNDSSFGAQFKLAGSDMWECSACMVRNKSGSGECVACGTGRPGAATKPPSKAAATTSSWGDKFKPASNTWECEACMVRNSSDLNACQACTTKRPGGAPAASTTPNTTPVTTSGWGDKFKKAEGSWDCSDCMVTNKSAALKCVACGAKKPGTDGGESSTSSPPKFSFGVPAGASGFTFGVQPSEKAEDKPPVETGFKFGATPASAETTGFTFGIPAASSPSTTPATAATTTSSAPAPVAAAADKPAFSFGVPKQAEAKTESSTQDKVPTFSFGQTSASSEPTRKRRSSGKESGATTTTSSESPKSAVPSIMFSASVGKEAPVAPSKTSSASPSAAKSVESTTPQKPPPAFGFPTGSSASLFKFSPKSTPAASTADSKPNQEVKPFFGSSTTVNSTFAFGQTSSEAPKPAVATFGSTTEASTPAKPFSFGQPSSDTPKPSKEAETPKPASVFGALSAKPTIVFGQTSSGTSKPAEAPKPPVTFSATPAADAREKPAFKFQPSTDSAPKPLTGFGSIPAAPMFGSSTNAFSTFGSSSSTGSAPPTFGSSASATPPSAGNPAPTSTPAAPGLAFGATNAVPSFGGSFAATEKTETKPPAVFSFGATSKPAATAPAFAFGAATPAVNGPSFGTQPSQPKAFPLFAPSNTAPASNPTFGNFSASSSAPASSASAAPTFGASNATPLFGGSSAPAFGAPTLPAFSGPNPAFGAAAAPNPSAAPASQFNFSASSAPGPVFTFGGNAPQNAAPSAPFSFTAKPAQAPPAFNPHVTPNFNFTSGGAVNFTATPGEAKPMPQRVIKKAMRRTQPR